MSDYPKFYYFDANHRVYEKDEKGYGRGGPIYMEYFRPIEVIGEDEKEYHTQNGRINKRSMKYYWLSQPKTKYQVFTEAEREESLWMNRNRYGLSKAIDRVRVVANLKKIAELIGYKGE